MDKNEAKKRISKLRDEIEKYRYAYHVEDRSIISDSALDSLKKELFDLENQYPDLVTEDSPTQRVGGKPLDKFEKVKHEEKMNSFNDAFSEEDIKDWLERAKNYLGEDIEPEFYVELKIDGFAIELVYENGLLVQASTRGDGETGENVTENIKTVEAIPLNLNKIAKIDIPERLIIRGEVFLSTKEFERINRGQEEAGGKLYANPRNVAAGSIRQLDSKITASRKLDSIVYLLVTDLGQVRHSEEHEFLHKLGFKTANKHNKTVRGLDELFKYRDSWEKRRISLPYEIDGVVVTINNLDIYDRLGTVGKAPRGAIAYKFSPEETTTKIKDIKLQVGRTGALTPVALLEPVNVGGVTIQHATLHNFDQIERLGLKIGDTVIVSRAGDVIPQITEVLPNLRDGSEKTFQIPQKCPIDGSEIKIEGAIYRCSNPKCGARLRENLDHFVSRSAFNIVGLGQKAIDRFIEDRLIVDQADIFRLSKDEVSELDGFGEKSAIKLISEIKDRKEITLPRFIYSLGILHIGSETSFLLAKEIQRCGARVNKPTDLIEILGSWSEEGLTQIRDIGPRVAESIMDWFSKDSHKKLLKELDDVGISITQENLRVSNKLSGKTFVVTGSLETLSREEVHEKIRNMGGDTSSTVSKSTDYLITGEGGGSKLNKATELGVEIIDEKEFLKMLQ